MLSVDRPPRQGLWREIPPTLLPAAPWMDPTDPDSVPVDPNDLTAVENPPYAHISDVGPSGTMVDRCREDYPELEAGELEGCQVVIAHAHGELRPGDYTKEELEAALARSFPRD